MSTISLPDQLYNKKTLFTLSGSAISVWLLTLVINDVFDLNQKHKWIGLIVSILLSFVGATQVRKLTVSLGTVALFNGLLIYVTATGIDSINNGVDSKTASKSDSTKISSLIPFLHSDPWWPPKELVKENRTLKEANTHLGKELVILKLSHDLLRDSLVAKRTPEKVTTITDDCKHYISEISILKERINSLSATPKPVTGNPKKEILDMLNIIQEENTKVLKALDDYLNIPLERPLDKRKKIPQLEEDIFAWRNSLIDYNSRIESIIKNK